MKSLKHYVESGNVIVDVKFKAPSLEYSLQAKGACHYLPNGTFRDVKIRKSFIHPFTFLNQCKIFCFPILHHL